MKQLPIYSTKSSKFFYEIILGNQLLNLYFNWNSRAEAWFLDVEYPALNHNIKGIKIVENWALLRQYKAILNIDGDFIVKCVNCPDENINYNNFGNGFDFFYMTATEAEEWESYHGIG